MDFLKSAVASAIAKGPLAPYVVADRVDVDNSIWTLNNATKREGNVKCSIFSFDCATNRGRLPIARNAVRKARTLHHPGVVKVIDTIETDANIYIVTERLTPLSWYIRRKSLGEETVKWGLCSVARTIKFINDEASSIHGCLSTSSIFTGDSGEWKVGGFDILSSMKDEDAVCYTYSSLVPDIGRLLPPEISRGSWDAIKRSPLSAVDSFDYGLLLYECFNGSFASAEQAGQAKGVPSNMQQASRRLLNSNPKARLSVANFLEQGKRIGGFFQTPLISLSEGVDKLGLMSEGERDAFFDQLGSVSSEFPEEFMRRRILPELLKSVEFGGGGPKVFSVCLQIGANISDDEFEAQLVPALIRLFASPDRAMRVCLLDNVQLIIDRLSAKIVNDKIFPHLVTGFTDQAPLLREQTVKAVLVIINKLSDRTVNGELLKYLAKTANDAEPGIRTNTTICLGKIAKNLSKATRSKVLIAAFTRSLRDPFIHARNAALMALAATSDMFSEDDAAGKILPALCPALIDKEKIIRDSANKTLDQYLSRVRKHASSLPDTVLPQPGTAAANGSAGANSNGPRMGTPSADPSSWAGWAISSFTNKLSAADGDIQPRQQSATGLQPPEASRFTASAPTTRPTSAASSKFPTAAAASRTNAPSLLRNATDTTKLAASFTAPEVTDNDDFWGSIDDEQADADADADTAWGAMDDDLDEQNANHDADDAVNGHGATPSTSTASTTTTSKTSAQHKATPSTTSTRASNEADEPDFAGWLKAQQSASKNANKPLPKGLASARPPAAAPRASSVGAAAVKKTAPGRTTAKQAQSAVAAKKKPAEKEENGDAEDDAWGEAWG